MTSRKLQLVDWLDDLCVRFIINLPHEELESVARICFQVEEAQWFYEDFIRPIDPTLPSLNLRDFCLAIFRHCPLLSAFSGSQHLAAYQEFLGYKTRVPVRGAILLNHDMDEVLLVKGWKKNASWSFPRGKINKDEKDLDCAVREVYEETGYDVREAGLTDDPDVVKAIDVTMREQHIRLFCIRSVPQDTVFAPRTRKEISKIEWYKLTDLPTFKKGVRVDAHLDPSDSASSSKFYMVAPFLTPLKKWIKQQHKLDAQQAKYGDLGEITEDGFQSTTMPAATLLQVDYESPQVITEPTHHEHLLHASHGHGQHPTDPASAKAMPVPGNTASDLLSILRAGNNLHAPPDTRHASQQSLPSMGHEQAQYNHALPGSQSSAFRPPSDRLSHGEPRPQPPIGSQRPGSSQLGYTIADPSAFASYVPQAASMTDPANGKSAHQASLLSLFRTPSIPQAATSTAVPQSHPASSAVPAVAVIAASQVRPQEHARRKSSAISMITRTLPRMNSHTPLTPTPPVELNAFTVPLPSKPVVSAQPPIASTSQSLSKSEQPSPRMTILQRPASRAGRNASPATSQASPKTMAKNTKAETKRQPVMQILSRPGSVTASDGVAERTRKPRSTSRTRKPEVPSPNPPRLLKRPDASEASNTLPGMEKRDALLALFTTPKLASATVAQPGMQKGSQIQGAPPYRDPTVKDAVDSRASAQTAMSKRSQSIAVSGANSQASGPFAGLLSPAVQRNMSVGFKNPQSPAETKEALLDFLKGVK